MSQINITVSEFIHANQPIIGFGPDSQCAYDVINRARIIAYTIGDWVGTMVYRVIPIVDHCFVLPYDLDVIRSAKSIDGRPLSINSIVSKEEFESCDASILTRQEGRTYAPFQLTDKQMCFYAINRNDIGSKVRVVYIDWSGSMHDDEIILGHGVHKAMRLEYNPRTILRITKGAKTGYVAMTQGSDIAYFDPRDKNPMFTVYSIAEMCNTQCIVIYAKKKYIPYSIDDDSAVLDINPEALASLIIAVKARDSRGDSWLGEYSNSVDLARNFLNAELTNEQSTTIGIAAVDYHSQLTEDLNQNYN